ncbi:hypothetical protein ACO0RG_003474 [Hanseniaspora osmophila]|uniref:Heat shock protein n=1 Tax=Hanseniaspora osmophila TaxID=56408 RepID=A0A1E5REN0_9ASCO|nr:heat shock protein [Hanseniaspora osmophila]
MSFNDLIKRSAAGNQAVSINPTSGIDIKITSHGSDWLWTCFSIFAFASVYYAFALLFKQKKNKITNLTMETNFVYLIRLWISAVMSYSYFTMASNLGYTGIQTEFHHVTTNDESFGGIRQIFYSKFISWFLCYPSLILLLFTFNFDYLLLNVKIIKFLFNYLVQWVTIEFFVIGLLIGSLIHSTYKWGYWTFACFMGLIYLFNFNCQLFHYKKNQKADYESGIASTSADGKKNKWLLCFINLFHQLIFLLYFISWSLGDGANVIQPDSDTVFFGILDLCNFCFIPLALSFLPTPELFTNIHCFENDALSIGSGAHAEKQLSIDEVRHSGDTHVDDIPVVNDNVAPAETTTEPVTPVVN